MCPIRTPGGTSASTPFQLIDVRRGSFGGDQADDGVVQAIDDQHQLAAPLVNHPLFRPNLVPLIVVASMNVVPTGTMGVETAGVAGGVGNATAATQNPPDGVGQEPPDRGKRQKSPAGFLQRREVENAKGKMQRGHHSLN